MVSRRDLMELAVSLRGLPVLGCLAGSPAACAGVRYGDVLLGVDGQLTESWDDYLRVRATSGVVLELRLFRDGQELLLQLSLADGPPRSMGEVLVDLQPVARREPAAPEDGDGNAAVDVGRGKS